MIYFDKVVPAKRTSQVEEEESIGTYRRSYFQNFRSDEIRMKESIAAR